MGKSKEDKIWELKEAISLIDSFVLRKNYHPDYKLWEKQKNKLIAKLEKLQENKKM